MLGPFDLKVEELCKDSTDGQRMPLSLLLTSAEDIILAPMEFSPKSEVELAVYPPMTNTLELNERPGPGEIVLLQIGHNTVRQVVAQRDDDILTPEQVKQH